jgi:transcriptional regulator with GAF, ATPase, and Fis domain
MSNAASAIARVKIQRTPSVPRPTPKSVPPPPPPVRPRVVSLADTDFALVEETPAPAPPRPASAPPISQTFAKRPVGDELVSALFDTMHELEFAPDSLDGARFCLAAIESVVPCRASMIHLYDPRRRDFLVVDARGEAAESMLLLRQDEKDPLFRVALPTGRPFAWNNLKNSPIGRLARFSSLSYVDRVLVAPVMNGKSCVGVIELADPKSGPFWTEDEHAVRYVADRFGAFLATHSAIVDLAIVARFAFKS